MIRVVLADDQALVRGGFRLILESEDDIAVVGEAADGHHAVSLVGELQPDVVLMDIQMPGMDGLEATRRIGGLGERARTRVLVLTTFERDDYVFEALRLGASGFLLKNDPPEELVRAVRLVAAGDALLAPSVTRRIIEEFATRPAPTGVRTSALEVLTQREREVLRLLAQGRSNLELAHELHVTEGTVKTHVSSILAKLGLRDRVQAVVLAYDAGLVTPGQHCPARRRGLSDVGPAPPPLRGRAVPRRVPPAAEEGIGPGGDDAVDGPARVSGRGRSPRRGARRER